MSRGGSLAVILLQCALISACTGEAADRTVTLRSGRPINAEYWTTINAPSGPVVFVVRYDTDRSLEEVAALQDEVSEVMQRFTVDADQAKTGLARVTVRRVQPGLLFKRGDVLDFYYWRRPDGSWVSGPSPFAAPPN